MLVTAANVGDVIRMDHKARCVMIEEVTDQYVQFRQETGDRYATFDRNIAGTVVRDPNRISEFLRNSEYGAGLAHAEHSALCKILDGTSDPAQREDAVSVLASIRGMKKNLMERISAREARESGSRYASLKDLISKANSTAGKSLKKEQPFGPGKISRPER